MELASFHENWPAYFKSVYHFLASVLRKLFGSDPFGVMEKKSVFTFPKRQALLAFCFLLNALQEQKIQA